MIKKTIFLATLLPCSVLPISVYGSENSGIEATNYEAAIGYYNSNYWTGYALGAAANLPVSGNVASNIVATFTDRNGEKYQGGRGFDSESRAFTATLFARDQEIGKAGIAGGISKSKHDYPASLASLKNQETKSYAIFGEYYLDSATIGASRAYADYDQGFDKYISAILVALYLPANTGVGLFSYRDEQDTDYNLVIIHQPYFLHNNAAITVDYHRNSSNHDFDSITLSFDFYFGTRVSLIDRDRKYR